MSWRDLIGLGYEDIWRQFAEQGVGRNGMEAQLRDASL